MDYKDTKESKLQEAIKGIKQGCNDQFYKKDEGKIEGLVEEITFVRQVKKVFWGNPRPRASQKAKGTSGPRIPVGFSG